MTLPRIGIDGFNLAMPNGTGVATYGYVLSETLRGMGHELTGLFGLAVGSRQELREVLFFDQLQRVPQKNRKRKPLHTQLWEKVRPVAPMPLRDVPLTALVEKSGFENRMPRFDRLVSAAGLFEAAHEYFATFGRFVRVSMENPPDIMHWTYPVPVTLTGARNIYTLHDMVPLRLPYTTLDVKKNYYQLVAQCAREATHLCTVSQASRDDIVSRFPDTAARLSVTYQASPLSAGALDGTAQADAQMIEGIFALKPRGYFLYFGAIEPKKNIGRLIEAYLTIQTRTPLVIVGARAWDADQELKLLGGGLGGQHLADRIVRLDYLPRKLLLKLIRGARAVTFPSLYEGFGLPVHEAMLMGTPVLTGNTSSLPEVAGDAALLVDPYSVDAIAAALARLDTDDALCADLGTRGLAWAERFSVAAYEEKLTAMYARVMAAPAR